MPLVPVCCFVIDPLHRVECEDGSEHLFQVDINNSDVASCEILTQRLPREAEIYKVICSSSSSSFYWTSVANAPNVLQPYWLIVLPLDVPDLTASLLL